LLFLAHSLLCSTAGGRGFYASGQADFKMLAVSNYRETEDAIFLYDRTLDLGLTSISANKSLKPHDMECYSFLLPGFV
jgi:hypothetical protein